MVSSSSLATTIFSLLLSLSLLDSRDSQQPIYQSGSGGSQKKKRKSKNNPRNCDFLLNIRPRKSCFPTLCNLACHPHYPTIRGLDPFYPSAPGPFHKHLPPLNTNTTNKTAGGVAPPLTDLHILPLAAPISARCHALHASALQEPCSRPCKSCASVLHALTRKQFGTIRFDIPSSCRVSAPRHRSCCAQNSKPSEVPCDK